MSLLIQVRGADFSALGLPKLQQTLFGFPAAGLKGLYLLEDGVENTVFSGPFTDSSGNGNHAKVRNTWTAPLKRASGITTNSEHGMIIETPIPANTSFSWVIVARHTLPVESKTGLYPTFAGSTDGLSADMTSGMPNLKGAVINVDLAGGSNFFNTWGVFSNEGALSRKGVVGTDASVVSVFGVTFDSISGDLIMMDISGARTDFNDEVVAAAIRGLAGNIVFGCWKHGNVYPISGENHLFAHYDRVLPETDLVKAMHAAKSRVESRGVAVV